MEPEVAEEDGCSSVLPLPEPQAEDTAFDLNDRLDRITPENRHGEYDMGKPVGREIW